MSDDIEDIDLDVYRSIKPASKPASSPPQRSSPPSSVPSIAPRSARSVRGNPRIETVDGVECWRANTVEDPIWVPIITPNDEVHAKEYLDEKLPVVSKDEDKTLHGRRSKDRTEFKKLLLSRLPHASAPASSSKSTTRDNHISDEKRELIDSVSQLQHIAASAEILDEQTLASMTLSDLAKKRNELGQKAASVVSSAASAMTTVTIIGASVIESMDEPLKRRVGITTKGYRDEIVNEKEMIEAQWQQIVDENPALMKFIGPKALLLSMMAMPLIKLNGDAIIEKATPFFGQQPSSQPPIE